MLSKSCDGKLREKKKVFMTLQQFNVVCSMFLSQSTKEFEDSIYWKAITASTFIGFFNFLSSVESVKKSLQNFSNRKFFTNRKYLQALVHKSHKFIDHVRLVSAFVVFGDFFYWISYRKCVNRFSLRGSTLIRASSTIRQKLS